MPAVISLLSATTTTLTTMLPSLRLANAHKPLIRFLGRRQWPASTHTSTPAQIPGANRLRCTGPEEQHPHPFAPSELKEHFADFVKKFQSAPSSTSTATAASSASKSGAEGAVYQDFWQAPPHLWKRELRDWEIELVQVRSLAED